MKGSMSNKASNGHDLVSAEMQLKKRYAEQRRKTQPSYVTNPKNDEHFRKTAERIVPLGLDPSNYIDAQFDSWTGEGYPQPSNLYSDSAVKRFEEIEEDERCPPKLEFETQKHYLRCYTINAGLGRDEALLATWTRFRSYFRILFCSDDVFPQAMSLFGIVGKRQLEDDSSLLAFLEKTHPEKLTRLQKQPVEDPVFSTADTNDIPPATPASECWENTSSPCH